MTVQLVVTFVGILCGVHLLLSPVKGDDSLEAWSCSPDTKSVPEGYQRKVSEVLNAMEVGIMTHSSWALLSQATGVSHDDVVGSAGCIPSKDMKNKEECYACIVAARVHLSERCSSNVRGSVYLNSCTLMYSPVDRTRVKGDRDEQTIDGGHVPERKADS